MSTRVKLALLALSIAPLASFAEDSPKLSCLKDFVFSQEFLAKYPNAGAACKEVVLKDGSKWARFDANVTKVKGNEVTTNFTSSYDNTISTVTFAVKPDARVRINDKEIKASDLKPGDSLSFWVPESRAGFYAAPGA